MQITHRTVNLALRKLRRARGLTLSDLYAGLGYGSEQALSRALRKPTRCTSDLITRYLAAVDADWLTLAAEVTACAAKQNDVG